MASNTRSTLDGLLKVFYGKGGLEEVVYKKRKFLAMLPKFQMGGKSYNYGVEYGYGGGGTSSFSDAMSGKTAIKVAEFAVTPATEYCAKTLDAIAAASSVTDAMAKAKAVKQVADAALNTVSNNIETSLFRTGGGSIGTVGSTSSNTVTLAVLGDICNFEVGDVLEITAGSTETGSLRSGTMTITSIDRSAGTFDCSGGLIGSITAGDHILRAGDDYAENSAYKKLRGLLAWINPSAASSSLFGVNCQVDSRLGGQRLDASAYTSQEEACLDGVSMASENEGAVSDMLMHPRKYREFVKELGSKATYEQVLAQGIRGKVAGVGWDSIVVIGDDGPVKVHSVKSCPASYAWGLELGCWELAYMAMSKGAEPVFFDRENESGSAWHRAWNETTAVDGWSILAKSYPNLACHNPGANVVITLP